MHMYGRRIRPRMLQHYQGFIRANYRVFTVTRTVHTTYKHATPCAVSDIQDRYSLPFLFTGIFSHTAKHVTQFLLECFYKIDLNYSLLQCRSCLMHARGLQSYIVPRLLTLDDLCFLHNTFVSESVYLYID